MKSNSIDTVLEVRLRHEPGTLARKTGMANTAAP